MIRFRAVRPVQGGQHAYGPGDVLPDARPWPTYHALLNHNFIEAELVAADGSGIPLPYMLGRPMKHGPDLLPPGSPMPGVEKWPTFAHLRLSGTVVPAVDLNTQDFWTPFGAVPYEAPKKAPEVVVEAPPAPPAAPAAPATATPALAALKDLQGRSKANRK